MKGIAKACKLTMREIVCKPFVTQIQHLPLAVGHALSAHCIVQPRELFPVLVISCVGNVRTTEDVAANNAVR